MHERSCMHVCRLTLYPAFTLEWGHVENFGRTQKVVEESEFLTVVLMKIQSSCRLVTRYQCFSGAYSLHYRIKHNQLWIDSNTSSYLV